MSANMIILTAAVLLALVTLPGTLNARYLQQQSGDICYLPLKPGPDEASCYAYFPSYYYNTQTGSCEYFVYGGCLGNANRFR